MIRELNRTAPRGPAALPAPASNRMARPVRSDGPALRAEIVTVAVDALTAEERDELRANEATIVRGARAWLEMGIALTAIRDKRLYRETHGTLEAYCWGTFHLDRSTIFRFIDAARKFQALSPLAEKLGIRFTAESQFRPLAHCEDRDFPDVLKLVAKKITPDADGQRVPTAKLLADAVQQVKNRTAPEGSAKRRVTDQAAEGEPRPAAPIGRAESRDNVAAAWQSALASAPRPRDGGDPDTWKGKPCPYASELRALAAILEEALASFPPTEEARRAVFALLTGRAVKLTQENEEEEPSPIGTTGPARGESAPAVAEPTPRPRRQSNRTPAGFVEYFK